MSTSPRLGGASTHTPRWLFAVGAFVLIGLSVVLFIVILNGGTRRGSQSPSTQATSTEIDVPMGVLRPRFLDGVLVPQGQEALPVRALMIDNQVDARPWSGISQAQLVIEAPVEGGITRLLAFFDASSTVPMIGPVRSARPYFVDWAQGWQALYGHVGGSDEALQKIRTLGKAFFDLNEMAYGKFYWRASTRVAPHSTYTKSDFLNEAAILRSATSSVPRVWRFQDASTSTEPTISKIIVGYGGSYSVSWLYSTSTARYTRSQGGKPQRDAEANAVEASNVVVLKTESEVLDSHGRLKVRTVGSGDALIYRNGQKYSARWRRSPGEAIRFESVDGAGLDIPLNRGTTWIEVMTEEAMFSALAQ